MVDPNGVYNPNSRFTADPEFVVVTRQGITAGTVCMMPVSVRGPQDSLYIVPLKHQNRWDNLCQELFGDPSLKWILMRHNKIDDPFSGPNAGDRLLVPTQDQINYYLQR